MFRRKSYRPIAARIVVSDSAAAAVEYALLLGCVLVIAMAAIALVGENTEQSFHNVAQSLGSEPAPSVAETPDRPTAENSDASALTASAPSTAAFPRPLLLALMIAASIAALCIGVRCWVRTRRTAKTARVESRESSVAGEQRLYDRRQKILRQLANNAARIFQSRLKVSDLMSEDIAVVLPGTKRLDLDTRMRHSGVRHVYVCAEDGRLLGIVRDLRLARASGADAAHLMDSNVPAVDASAPVSQAITTMLNDHPSGLAVVEGGTLRGEITLIELAIALQCFLQILTRMGQLVDCAAPADDELLAKIADLHSTQQVRLRALAEQVAQLKDDDGLGQWKQIHEEADLLVDSSHRLLKNVQRGVGDLEQRMCKLATLFDTRTDELTGVGNARALDESLSHQCALRKRYDQPVSLMLLRLEAFDTPGFAADPGEYDQRIRAWAMWLEERVRDTDVVARYADQVFAVVLPHTDHTAACCLRDRLHKSLFAKGLGGASAVIVTAEEDDTAKKMVSRGEQMLGQTNGAGSRLAAKA